MHFKEDQVMIHSEEPENTGSIATENDSQKVMSKSCQESSNNLQYCDESLLIFQVIHALSGIRVLHGSVENVVASQSSVLPPSKINLFFKNKLQGLTTTNSKERCMGHIRL